MKNLQKLENLLAQGKIGRREFMVRSAALGAAAAAPALLMAGEAKAAMPKRGGRLRIGTAGGSTTDSLDTSGLPDTMPQNISFGQLRNCLVEIDHEGKPIPELAESWEATPDAKRWAFKLRRGVEFHNGKTLDAEDVIFSINHHRGKKSKSAAKGVVDPIKEIKADGKNTVVFTLAGGNANFPFIMSDYHLSIVPNGTKNFNDGMGTGGYKLVSFEPGVKAITKRNPNYWKEGRAHFDEAEVLVITDVTARTNALTTGETDVMDRADIKTVHLLARNKDVRIEETSGTQHFTFAMRTDTAPFDNNDLRLALKYAIDREEWLRVIFKDLGQLANDYPVGPANQFLATEEEIPQRAYDPDKAKFHLKKAGYDSIDLKLHMSNTAFEGAVDAGTLYAERARPAGINLEIVREPDDGYWDNVWLVKPWVASYWGGRPTEDWVFSQIYATGADWNETHFAHERFMELLTQGKAELDNTKRREIYVEMQRIMHDEGGAVIPLYMGYVMAASDKLHIPEQLGNNWEIDGEKAQERWWFK